MVDIGHKKRLVLLHVALRKPMTSHYREIDLTAQLSSHSRGVLMSYMACAAPYEVRKFLMGRNFRPYVAPKPVYLTFYGHVCTLFVLILPKIIQFM